MKTLISIGFFLCFMGAFSYNNPERDTLNIAEYLKHADGDKIYPSAKQMEMLKKVMPNDAYKAAPQITDRAYWDAMAATSSGKVYLNKAMSLLDEKPEVPISDEIYRRANKEGNRGIYKPRYYRTMDRLEHFILAECLENKGRFLPQINTYVQAIMDMKSWLHPNHDDNNNGVLEGKRVTIDLGARKFGGVLAIAESLLGNSLSQAMRTEIKKQLQWRITDSYLKSCKLNDKNNTWIKSTSNWNSVCTSGSVLVTIINSKSAEERLAAVGSSINSMKYYISGFGDDGYCSEGLGYWGYGFNHYLYLAQMLSDYTEGKINLFSFDNPEKLKRIGNFPEHFEIQNGTCAPFADGVSHTESSGSNFAEMLSSKHYGAIKPSEIRMEEAVEQIIAWNNPELFSVNNESETQKSELNGHTYFDDFGMVISRGKQKVPFSIAIKAGHNAENHNHSDVGTYILILDEDFMSGDIGAPSYTAGSFSKDNKARSSWGHPVPRINNTLQSNGREFEGKITETIFENNSDKVVMDMKAAYELPMLKSLTRTMVNDKSGTGTISVQDYFAASEPVTFGTAIMTYTKYEIIDNHTVILTSKSQKVKAEVAGIGGQIKIKDEQVPVKSLREGGTAYRIGIDFEKPIKEGSIVIKYTPVLGNI
ncbi:hypothetical protein ACFSKN_05275 [Mariniflexile gromovii]|uniref:Heparinase II/III-like protein n=1 Tax=Mariniflexile gromovii TaxID=362523 RepID=A0ABS4BTD6_9FLAO|nr:hypothetical protein [Mariniflexile gromovii]MBP0903857.1 hypothetical protein [Mariniflexile gromovii]